MWTEKSFDESNQYLRLQWGYGFPELKQPFMVAARCFFLLNCATLIIPRFVSSYNLSRATRSSGISISLPVALPSSSVRFLNFTTFLDKFHPFAHLWIMTSYSCTKNVDEFPTFPINRKKKQRHTKRFVRFVKRVVNRRGPCTYHTTTFIVHSTVGFTHFTCAKYFMLIRKAFIHPRMFGAILYSFQLKQQHPMIYRIKCIPKFEITNFNVIAMLKAPSYLINESS